MTVTTQWGNKTIDPPMFSRVETDTKENIDMREVSREFAIVMYNKAKVNQKVIPIPRPPPLYHRGW